MGCLALDSPTIPEFRGRRHHRIPSVLAKYCRNTPGNILDDEKTSGNEDSTANESEGLLHPYVLSNGSDFFDGTRTTLYNDQSFTLFEDHVLVHSYHFPSMKIKRILYRNILNVSTEEELVASWYSMKTWSLIRNGTKRPTTLFLTIRNKYRRVELSVKDPSAYSLLKRLVYEANNTPLTID